MSKNIYIFVEVAKRELDSRMAIAMELAKKGCKVIIGDKNQILWGMYGGKYPPGVILDKCAQLATQKRFQKLINKGFIYTVMDEESLITNKEYFNKTRFSKDAEDLVALNFMVSEIRSKELIEDYPNAKNLVVGNPRFSMLRPEWKYWFEDEYNEIKDTYGEFILIVSSFNNYPKVYDYVLEDLRQVDEFFKERVETFVKNKHLYNFNIVLRPHPSDMPFHNMVVPVDGRFNIIPWIMASKAIINAKCTTSLEAFIAGKRAFTWRFQTKEKSYKLANIFADEVSAMGSEVNENWQNRRAKILEANLKKYDDPFYAIDRIVKSLIKLSFSSKEKIKIRNISGIIHIKNKMRFALKGDDYTRITQKFTEEDAQYALKKLEGKVSEISRDRLVIQIN